MYYNGQVVHYIDKNIPVRVGSASDYSQWAWSGLPKNTKPYVIKNTDIIVLPGTCKIAKCWLRVGYIEIRSKA